MAKPDYFRLQFSVFALVSASFVNIYITQPVLPVLEKEFGSDMVRVSLSVSAVILGIALSNLPFGILADRRPIRPIVLAGGVFVAAGGLICAMTHHLWILIAMRFLQGLFIPASTTCLAAYLAKTLPIERLNVVMGSYVSATVVGGLGGRMLGGLIHPPLHWRYAFVSASVLTLLATLTALRAMPRAPVATAPRQHPIGFWALLKRRALWRYYFCAAGSFAVFSSIFNYLPFRLAGPPFHFSTQVITLLYLVYVMGIFVGPISGRISNRIGNGNTLIAGGLVLGVSLALVLSHSIVVVVIGLLGICTGFFSVHAAAVGALNKKLVGGQGLANALYVLFYYLGGWMGITITGLAYQLSGWLAVVLIGWLLLLIPIGAGIFEKKGHAQ